MPQDLGTLHILGLGREGISWLQENVLSHEEYQLMSTDTKVIFLEEQIYVENVER